MFINVDGTEMNYAVFGHGKRNLVILPGLTVKNASESVDAVRKVYEKYLDEFTFYLIDRRENVSEGYSVYDMADDTVSVLKHLGIEKTDIYGASQGGIVALIIAAKYPETVNIAVAASTVAKNSKEVIAEWVKLALKKDRKALAESFTVNVYSEATQKAVRDLIFAQSQTYTDSELYRFAIISDAITHFDVTETLKKVSCPTLFIASEGDNVFGAEATKSTASLIKNSTIFVYPKTYGHAVYDEAPDFAERIMRFLI